MKLKLECSQCAFTHKEYEEQCAWCFIDFNSRIGMPIKTPCRFIKYKLANCFDRKSFSACYQSEDVKEYSQSIRVVIFLASTILCLFSQRKSLSEDGQVWYVFSSFSLLTVLWGWGISLDMVFGSKKQCSLDFIMVRVASVSLEVASNS